MVLQEKGSRGEERRGEERRGEERRREEREEREEGRDKREERRIWRDKHPRQISLATGDELDGVRWFDSLNLNLLLQSSNLKTPMSRAGISLG